MNIDHISPESLTRRSGFRSRKSNAMTGAERQRKWRLKYGGRAINMTLTPEVAAGYLYLKREWGMRSDREVMEAAVRFLVLCTRQGLKRLPQSIDD